jgi:SAM-dependent methyltransferase
VYEAFSSDYDRFVNWKARLRTEMPWIEQQLQQAPQPSRAPMRVLDAACGTGMHAIALAQRGFAAAGADLSASMIERARQNAAAAGVEARFEAAGFGTLRRTFGPEMFEAVLCLGNSLPHVLSPAVLAEAIEDFAACLNPGGVLIVQNRNFEAVTAQGERWMEPQAHREGGREWIFVRFYDFDPDGLITFNILTLKREEPGDWTQQTAATRLRPMMQADLNAALSAAGFGNIRCYGNMSGAPFEAETSGNLVVVARRINR